MEKINVTHAEMKDIGFKALIAVCGLMLTALSGITAWALMQIIQIDKQASIHDIQIKELDRRSEVTNAKLSLIDTKLDTITDRVQNMRSHP